MIEVLESPSNVVAYRVSGRLTSEEYDRIIERIEAALAKHERIGMFADMADFDDLSAEVFAKDFKYGLSKIGQWKRFARSALVTDKHWMRSFAKVCDVLLPTMDIRAYEPARRDEAFAWISGVS